LKRETPEEKRKRLFQAAKESISRAYAGEEHSIMQAINAYKEIDKTKNILYERLEEWYSMYFPELSIGSQTAYAKFVLKFGANKKAADISSLKEVFGNNAESIKRKIDTSIGREPTKEEYSTISRLAEMLLSAASIEDDLDRYLKESTKRLMPNIVYLIDYKIAAEMLSRAGSLTKLAMMPASTIQLLGAEKALFRHIKFGSKPPKYGVLFKMNQMSSTRRDERGRLARIYAAKLSIASKADAFSKRFIANKLKADIDKALRRK